LTGKLEVLWATKTPRDEWWSSFVTAPLGIAANYFAVEFGWITPNRITLASFLVAVLAALCMVIGGTANFVAAALLIHLSHVLDCMDGQMARYRKVSSALGSYADRLTDQIQVTLWFGAAGYAAHLQTQDAEPLLLAFIGVAFYGLRGYAKYVAVEIGMSDDPDFQTKLAASRVQPVTAGLGFGLRANLWWLLREQRKIIEFDEGVFIFMLGAALLLDALMPMLWVFAVSQLSLGLFRALQHGLRINANAAPSIQK
jgi:phosphatidylglycerophosphate synthase